MMLLTHNEVTVSPSMAIRSAEHYCVARNPILLLRRKHTCTEDNAVCENRTCKNKKYKCVG